MQKCPVIYLHLPELLLPSFISMTTSLSLCEPSFPDRGNAKLMCCCWWCTGATSWIRPAGIRALRAATWPPWPPCWRRWRGRTSRLPANTWWSNWCRVQPCAPKPSPWCPSECGRHYGQLAPFTRALESRWTDDFRRRHQCALTHSCQHSRFHSNLTYLTVL